jgi:hypothetical protein
MCRENYIILINEILRLYSIKKEKEKKKKKRDTIIDGVHPL